MSRRNTTIDDNSPLILYSPQDQWHPGLAADDNFASSYSNGGTFTVTNTTFATVTFEFNGTGVWLYGAKRSNHGVYSVTLDGESMGNMSGSSSDGLQPLSKSGNEFQALLFGASNLTSDAHVVVLTNEGTADTSFLDLDFIRWETSSGQDGLTLSPTFSEADLSSNTLTVNGTGWGQASDDRSLSSSSGIFTKNAGDSVELSFEGVNAYGHHATCIAELTSCDVTGIAVQIFGSIGVACGDFSIEIDGGASKTYNASRYQNLTSQLLFSGGNLGSGQHTLKLTNGQSNTGVLVLDHSISYAAIAMGTSTSTSPTASSTSQSGSSSGPSKALIGGICGALSAVAVLLIVLYLWLRRRRRMVATHEKTASKLEAFDIDNDHPRFSHIFINSSIHSGSLRNSPRHSDILPNSHHTSPNKKSRALSHNTTFEGPISARSSRSKYVYSPTHGHDDHVIKNPSSSRLPHEYSSRNSSANSFNLIHGAPNHAGHKRSNRHMAEIIKTTRPLPNTHASSSKTRNASSSSTRRLPIPPMPSYKFTSIKRRRSVRNSRVLRAGYNIFFAKPGSSTSGSAYAPSTVLTSEISERPATTLSPVTEAPPPLPSNRSPIQAPIQAPQRTLRIANQADDY